MERRDWRQKTESDKLKEEYLKKFPVYEQREQERLERNIDENRERDLRRKDLFIRLFCRQDLAESGESRQRRLTDPDAALREEAVCLYCQNARSHRIRTSDRDSNYICDDCRREFLENKADIYEAVYWTSVNLNTLFEMEIRAKTVIKVRRLVFLYYKFLNQKREDPFGVRKDWIRVKRGKSRIVFSIKIGLPRSTVVFVAALNLIDSYFESRGRAGFRERFEERGKRIALVKWYAVHYMRLNGYIDYARGQDERLRKNSGGEGEFYRDWRDLLGTPLANRRVAVSELTGRLRGER